MNVTRSTIRWIQEGVDTHAITLTETDWAIQGTGHIGTKLTGSTCNAAATTIMGIYRNVFAGSCTLNLSNWATDGASAFRTYLSGRTHLSLIHI